jgi:hypothetical protein
VAARWLAEHDPDSPNQTLFTGNIPAAAAFFPGRLLPLTPDALSQLNADDFLLYVSQDWQSEPDSFAMVDGRPVPVNAGSQMVVEQFTFNGLVRAVVYTGLIPTDFALTAIHSYPQFIPIGDNILFGDKLSITSAKALPAAWPDKVRVVIIWQAAGGEDYFYRLELVDTAGDIWVGQEEILLNQVDHPARFWLPGENQEVFYTLSLPPDLPPGEYSLQVTVFDGQGGRLGVFAKDGRFAGVAARLASLSIPAPTGQPPIEPPNPISSGHELAGYRLLPEQAGTGEPLKLDLWWRQLPTTPAAGRLLLSIGPETAEHTLSTNMWLPDQIYHIRPSWSVPANLLAGRYPLALQWVDENGRAQWPSPIVLGEIEIVARSRSFDLPPDLIPLQIQIGTVALLQEAAVEVTEGEIILSVTWQVVEPDGVFYTTFVHLRDAEGGSVGQADRPPAEPTHTWVSGQVIRETYHLARPEGGRYIITIGLYDQTNGLRLPVYSAAGIPLPDEQYVLEVTVP